MPAARRIGRGVALEDAAVVVAAVVEELERPAARNAPPQLVGKVGVGRRRVGEQRVAARRRNLDGVKTNGPERMTEEGMVRMEAQDA